MPLIDHTYFIGELNIPDTGKENVQEWLSVFISKYEPELLQAILGYALYKAFKVGLTVTPIEARWTALRDGKEYTSTNGHLRKWPGLIVVDGLSKRSPIANYVYFHWSRDKVSRTTATGEVKDNSEGSTGVSAQYKQKNAWNEMAYWISELIVFLNANEATYPEWKEADRCAILQEFRPINIFNL